ncbi:MAG: DUF86 domain-containing protein [Algoriphagus sp.]|uniref:HepT-like ribonuclease domain-containing protein n=1 Tax=Algoriphagus sp. TaxID=1872435 RepID=UPI00272F3BA2|nr:HepT-like ribonuclease domain-containing protein [Algoriphagus sp.]MDP2041743.1 DUF86 domain-containing protein [Algoriphagus sp.]MDP3473646.1 DUF86 domain-containing protein [Algoriphagus sp.]
MTDREQKYLIDIINSCLRIESFLSNQSFGEFSGDIKTQSAVERQLGIIGEVLSQLRKTESNIKFTSQSEIIGLRNRLIHAYDGIDLTIIWAIAKTHLPKLKVEVTEKLNSK